MTTHIRSWRGLALGLALLLASGLQGCFLLHIGSRANPLKPDATMAPALGVDQSGPNTIREFDPEGLIHSRGPQLIV